jgi:uncharacterized membrane protein YraQ (UPF0718 family)
MTVLFGILAVILVIAIIFGRRVAARLVIFGVVCCIAFGLCVAAYILYLMHLQDVRKEHVKFAMSHLPPEISDASKAILRNEFEWYFGGTYDKQYVPDLEVIDQYLQRVDPSLVRHKP